MENNKVAFKYTQQNQIFISTILKYQEINKIAKVSVYGPKNPTGYQRNLEERHLSEISKSIKNENISPNSIILGMNKSVFERTVDNSSQLSKITGNNHLVLLNIKELYNLEDEQKLRIIDGQHRIKAIQQYLKNNQDDDVKDMNFNVLIFIVEDGKLEQEVDLFININSKAKRIRTDLAIMAKYNIKKLEHSANMNPYEVLVVQTAILINSNPKNKLYNAIRVDPNDTSGIGTVSINAFLQAASSIISKAIEKDIYKSQMEHIKKLKQQNNISDMEEKIYLLSKNLEENIFLPMWEIIAEKWPESFLLEESYNESENSISENKYYYNKKTYTQQTLGIKALSYIMENCIKHAVNIEEAMNKFKFIIMHSPITNQNWVVPKRNSKQSKSEISTNVFKGMSSEAGFKKAMQLIEGRA